MKDLYPEIEAYNTETLKVSAIHTIYFEESGNKNGIPVIHLHGGPGSGCSPKNRQNYNPNKYRIILFDQRGCGQSTPQGELQENTTPNLIEDIEKLRKHLNINTWVVSGSSWGSTLAIAYAEKYPQYVKTLFIRGVFLATQKEADWTQKPDGAASFFPDKYEPYKNFIPKNEQNNLPLAYLKRLTGNNYELAKQAAINHLTWEGSLLKMEYRAKKEALEKESALNPTEEETDYDFLITLSKILNHYTVNNFFINEGELLKNAHKLKNIPVIIIQGRYDMFCPLKTAWKLHNILNNSKLIIVSDAGHSGSEPETVDAIINATDEI